MLKNKIIALLSVASMMFSFAAVVNAEKTPIVTDPTFAVAYNKDNGDGTHSYYFGVNFEDANPFTFKSTVTNPDEVEEGEDPIYEYSGIGLQLLDIILEANDASAAITKVTGTKGISFTQANLDINYTATAVADYNKLTARKDAEGNVVAYTKFTVTTNKYVDPADFKCAKLTLAIKDATNANNSWVYSSDPGAITAGAADFLAYTAPAANDDEDDKREGELAVATKETINVSGTYVRPFVRATMDGVSKDFYLPAGVRGGEAVIRPIFKYDSAAVAAGKTVTFDLGDKGEVLETNVGSITTK